MGAKLLGERIWFGAKRLEFGGVGVLVKVVQFRAS